MGGAAADRVGRLGADREVDVGAARPLAHSAFPVGCDGSGSIATSRPSSTTA
jgi:hypothetical protein